MAWGRIVMDGSLPRFMKLHFGQKLKINCIHNDLTGLRDVICQLSSETKTDKISFFPSFQALYLYDG